MHCINWALLTNMREGPPCPTRPSGAREGPPPSLFLAPLSGRPCHPKPCPTSALVPPPLTTQLFMVCWGGGVERPLNSTHFYKPSTFNALHAPNASKLHISTLRRSSSTSSRPSSAEPRRGAASSCRPRTTPPNTATEEARLQNLSTDQYKCNPWKDYSTKYRY